MKIFIYGILGTALGGVIGYWAFGRIGGELISVEHIFKKAEGIGLIFEPFIKGMREKILMTGLGGGAVGLIIGAVNRQKKA